MGNRLTVLPGMLEMHSFHYTVGGESILGEEGSIVIKEMGEETRYSYD